MKTDPSWWFGQAAAIAVTLGMLTEYSTVVAVAVGYTLSVLIDIRHEVASQSRRGNAGVDRP